MVAITLQESANSGNPATCMYIYNGFIRYYILLLKFPNLIAVHSYMNEYSMRFILISLAGIA